MPRSESVGDLISLISPRRLRVGHDPTEMRLRMRAERIDTYARARIARAVDYHRHFLDLGASEGHDIDRQDYALLDAEGERDPDFAKNTEERVEGDIAAAIGAYGYDYVLAIVKRVGKGG